MKSESALLSKDKNAHYDSETIKLIWQTYYIKQQEKCKYFFHIQTIFPAQIIRATFYILFISCISPGKTFLTETFFFTAIAEAIPHASPIPIQIGIALKFEWAI